MFHLSVVCNTCIYKKASWKNSRRLKELPSQNKVLFIYLFIYLFIPNCGPSLNHNNTLSDMPTYHLLSLLSV